MLTLNALDEEEMECIGACIAQASNGVGVIYFQGDLGVGKTTLCRGILHRLGHIGAVKSPTYTLVEPYEFTDFNVYHFDLYRIDEVKEVFFLGYEEFLYGEGVAVVEWADKLGELLPKDHLAVELTALKENERMIKLSAKGRRYRQFIEKIKS